MSAEIVLYIVGAVASAGVFVGVTRTQTKTLGDEIKKLDVKVDRCVTKSDFPAFFARERQNSEHGGE